MGGYTFRRRRTHTQNYKYRLLHVILLARQKLYGWVLFSQPQSSRIPKKVILSHPCIINDMSRIRDSNGLIVASWCLTRNRERDVIISRMTSCPPPGLWHCTLYMALYNCTEQYRSPYPSSVSKRRSSDLAASSRHPPLELVSDRQYRIFSAPPQTCDVRARLRSESCRLRR